MRNNLTGGQPRKPAGQEFYGGQAAAPGNGARNGSAAGGAARVVQPAETVGARSMRGLLANALLGALPPDDFERLLPALEPFSLAPRCDLNDSDDAPHVYFPEGAVVSHLVVFEDGGAIEAAMTGSEGLVGLGVIFGQHTPTHWPRVTLAGSALRMSADLFRQEFEAGGAFRRLVLEHAGRHAAQVSQRAACVSRHRIESRLAAWLLMLHERAGSDDMPLTHEFIARRIGARRAGISEVAGKFQERQLISYSRGALRILDRRGLEAAACECYGVLRDTQPPLVHH